MILLDESNLRAVLQTISFHALLGAIYRMNCRRVPAFEVHLTLKVIHAIFTFKVQRKTVGAVRPFQLVPASETDIALLVAST
jgi:virulence-associated protein VapD